MQRSYLASLAVVSVLVLVVGVFTRDRLYRTEEPGQAPPSEAAALQQLSQEAQLRRTAGYFFERVEAVAPLVQYVDASGASGIRWNADTVVTTSGGAIVSVVVEGPGQTLGPVPALGTDSARRDWVLVVGRLPDGRVLWTHGIAGGVALTRCGSTDVREVVLGVALQDAMAGAGVFDLTGRTVGMVVRCGARLAALTAGEVRRLLGAASEGSAAWTAYGLAAQALDERTREHFASDSGLLVTAVRVGGLADRAGVRPGDLLLQAGDRPLGAPDVLDSVAAAERGDSLALVRRRGRARTRVTLTPTGDAAPAVDVGARRGIALTAAADDGAGPGAPVRAVREGTVAAVAGLRPGDILRFVDGTAVTSATAAERLLDRARGRPAFLVFERDSVRRGVLLPP